jgi:hypothetical protein
MFHSGPTRASNRDVGSIWLGYGLVRGFTEPMNRVNDDARIFHATNMVFFPTYQSNHSVINYLGCIYIYVYIYMYIYIYVYIYAWLRWLESFGSIYGNNNCECMAMTEDHIPSVFITVKISYI